MVSDPPEVTGPEDPVDDVGDVRTGRSAPPLRFWLMLVAPGPAQALGAGPGDRDRHRARDRHLCRAVGVGSVAPGELRRLLPTRRMRTTCSCRSPRTRPSTATRCALRSPPAPHPEWVADLTTSLAVSVQVDASTADETILVPGRMVGVETDREPTPPVDTLSVTDGRGLGPADTGADVAVLDAGFAAAHDLPATGVLRLGGDEELPWVGTGQSPRYFLAGAETGSLFGARGFAVLFTSLARAQAEAGTPGQVSEASISLAPGVDPDAARVRARLARSLSSCRRPPSRSVRSPRSAATACCTTTSTTTRSSSRSSPC